MGFPMKWTPADIIALVGAVGLLITAIAAATAKILGAIHNIHRDVNSRMDELVSETRKAALAEGRSVGRTEGRRQEQERSLHGQERPPPRVEGDLPTTNER